MAPAPPTVSETFIVDEFEMMKKLAFPVEFIALAPSRASTQTESRSARVRLRAWCWIVLRRWYRLPSWLLAVRRFRGTPRWVVLRSLDLAAGWLREAPEGVHVHFVDQTAVAATLAARLTRVPVSATAHGRDVLDPPKSRLGALAHYGVRFVAVCRYNRALLVERGVPLGSIVVIPCGVDTRAHGNGDRTIAGYGGSLRILVVGRLVAKKGIDDLLRAVAISQISDLVEEVRIIGDGPERDRLEVLAEDARVAGVRVQMLGPLPRSDHGPHQSWANLFCLPCKIAPDGDRDSSPLAIKEALVVKLPVVTTAVAGIPELLDIDAGIFVEPGDFSALGAGLARYAALSDRERARLAEAGNACVNAQFRIEDTVAALGSFLRDGIAPSRWIDDQP